MHARGKEILVVGALGLSIGVATAVTLWLSQRPMLPPASREPRLAYGTSSHVIPGHNAVVSAGNDISPVDSAEVAALERHLGAMPTDTLAVGRLAQLLESSHQPEQAARHYRRLLTINQGSRQAWFGLARVYATLENWEAAEGAIATFLEAVPGDPEAMYHLGVVHANRGDYSSARSWWRKVQQQTRDPAFAKRAAESLQRISGSSS
ncbi:MAG: tetratricopeptide repeat protein [Gemmatimonadales bacterium]|nr:MAG: tetratricopeptide repeat protein [Gemmatimonadales bacterium]